MGRTVPTFRQLIDDAIARWSKFRRALRREDQEYFDRLFRRVRSYTQAATYQASDNPMEAILLSIALDQEKRLDALERAALPRITDAGSTLALNDSGEAWSPPRDVWRNPKRRSLLHCSSSLARRSRNSRMTQPSETIENRENHLGAKQTFMRKRTPAKMFSSASGQMC